MAKKRRWFYNTANVLAQLDKVKLDSYGGWSIREGDWKHLPNDIVHYKDIIATKPNGMLTVRFAISDMELNKVARGLVAAVYYKTECYTKLMHHIDGFNQDVANIASDLPDKILSQINALEHRMYGRI